MHDLTHLLSPRLHPLPLQTFSRAARNPLPLQSATSLLLRSLPQQGPPNSGAMSFTPCHTSSVPSANTRTCALETSESLLGCAALANGSLCPSHSPPTTPSLNHKYPLTYRKAAFRVGSHCGVFKAIRKDAMPSSGPGLALEPNFWQLGQPMIQNDSFQRSIPSPFGQKNICQAR